jgi:hypothetical protein
MRYRQNRAWPQLLPYFAKQRKRFCRSSRMAASQRSSVVAPADRSIGVVPSELCRKGEVCTNSGRCGYGAQPESCIARSQLDGRSSKQRKESGLCKLDPQIRHCLPGRP